MRIRNRGLVRKGDSLKKKKSGHELFEQATNEYAPVSHIHASSDVPPLMLPLVHLSFFVTLILFRILPNTALAGCSRHPGHGLAFFWPFIFHCFAFCSTSRQLLRMGMSFLYTSWTTGGFGSNDICTHYLPLPLGTGAGVASSWFASCLF